MGESVQEIAPVVVPSKFRLGSEDVTLRAGRTEPGCHRRIRPLSLAPRGGSWLLAFAAARANVERWSAIRRDEHQPWPVRLDLFVRYHAEGSDDD
jgi:hypothetical protein